MGQVEEESVRFEPLAPGDMSARLTGSPFEGPNRYRTFGAYGPLYEVLSVEGDRVRIWLYNSGEEAEYPLDHALEDPVKH